MLTFYQRNYVRFTWDWSHNEFPNYYSADDFDNYSVIITAQLPRAYVNINLTTIVYEAFTL